MDPTTQQPILVSGGNRQDRPPGGAAAPSARPRRANCHPLRHPSLRLDRSRHLASALQGVGAVYVDYYPDLAVPGAVEVVRSFAELAVRSGIPRLVLLSGRGEPEAERAEQAVRDTGAELTILRSTWFMQNFSEDYMVEHMWRGKVRFPASEVPTPFVDAEDIADVAVAALTDDLHVGELCELTGPQSLTFVEAAAGIAEASGRQVRHVPVSLEQHAAEAAAHGVSPEVVELLTYLFSEVMDGRNAAATDGVRRALGREPRDFSNYALRAAATGAWSGSAAAA
jgi:uncharacterized protein YbjT (DUF2867 family)